jgi:hypothetical protein
MSAFARAVNTKTVRARRRKHGRRGDVPFNETFSGPQFAIFLINEIHPRPRLGILKSMMQGREADTRLVTANDLGNIEDFVRTGVVDAEHNDLEKMPGPSR